MTHASPGTPFWFTRCFMREIGIALKNEKILYTHLDCYLLKMSKIQQDQTHISPKQQLARDEYPLPSLGHTSTPQSPALPTVTPAEARCSLQIITVLMCLLFLLPACIFSFYDFLGPWKHLRLQPLLHIVFYSENLSFGSLGRANPING